MWEVYWFSCTGEECVESFNSQSDAQYFIEYNDWQKNEHPKLREVKEQ